MKNRSDSSDAAALAGATIDAAAPLSALLSPRADSDTPAAEALGRLLAAIRTHLGMDAAFLAEFVDGRRHFRHVDTDDPRVPLEVGASDPLEESYCQRVVDGRLPSLIRDAAMLPAALELPVTTALPVGAHLSVPVTLSNGQLYGTFCCFSLRPDQTLTSRDVDTMRVFAQLAADYVERDHAERLRRRDIEGRINNVMEDGGLSSVYQPIYRLTDHRIVGFEALSRFDTSPTRSPDIWFNEAASVGLSEALESAAIRSALVALKHLPADIYISVNVSPELISDSIIADVLAEHPVQRIILEVTEHAAIGSYAEIAAALAPLRQQGLHLAVDDTGAGYASFRHILNLSADVIKLDSSITCDIDRDQSRRSLAAALIGFAAATGTRLIAEGVETAAELSTLRELGVVHAQGYHLSKPLPLDSALQLLNAQLEAGIESAAARVSAKDTHEGDSASWHVVVLNDRQIARLDALRLEAYFETFWLTQSAPRDAAMFTEARLTRGRHPFYLSPAAARMFVPFLHGRTSFRADPCAPPSTNAVDLVIGHPEEARKVLRYAQRAD